MYFGIFPEDRGGGRARGGRCPYFPHILCPTTKEQTLKRRGDTVAPSPGRMHKATPTHTQTGPLPTPGAGPSQRSRESTVDSRGRGRKQQGPSVDRQLAPSCPIPALSPKSTEYPSSLLGHSPIASSSFQLLGTKRKKVQSRGLKSIPQTLSLMPEGLSPAQSGKG